MAPYTGANPLAVNAGSFSMNPLTGEMLFIPNAIQESLVTYNVEEYRSGLLVGTCQFETTVLVYVCDTPCAATTTTVTPTPPNAVKKMENDHTIELFPNPAINELTIKTQQGTYNSYSISNMLGKVVFQSQINGSQTYVNVNALPQGLYYITLKGSGGIVVQKFVKE